MIQSYFFSLERNANRKTKNLPRQEIMYDVVKNTIHKFSVHTMSIMANVKNTTKKVIDITTNVHAK